MAINKAHRPVYAFIESHIRTCGMSPTMREIETALKKSRGSVQNSLMRLEKAGKIRRTKRKSRSIVIVEPTQSEASQIIERGLPTKPTLKSAPTKASVKTSVKALATRHPGSMSPIRPSVISLFSTPQSLPVRGEIAAGFCHEPFTEVGEYLSLENSCKPSDYVLKVSGDSMEGVGIFHGSFVGIRPVPDGYRPKQGQIVAAWVEGQGTTLKHFYQKGSVVVLEAANAKYPPMIFDLKTCHLKIQGVHLFTLQTAAYT